MRRFISSENRREKNSLQASGYPFWGLFPWTRVLPGFRTKEELTTTPHQSSRELRTSFGPEPPNRLNSLPRGSRSLGPSSPHTNQVQKVATQRSITARESFNASPATYRGSIEEPQHGLQKKSCRLKGEEEEGEEDQTRQTSQIYKDSEEGRAEAPGNTYAPHTTPTPSRT